MTIKELIAALDERYGADDLWTGRAISLLEALDGTGVDPTRAALMDDMVATEGAHPRLAAWLDGLPGFRSDRPGARAKAKEQLSYLTLQINAVAS